jgi:predicted nucleic acid-binding protein
MIADSSAWIDMLRGPASEVGRRLEQALRQGEPLLMPYVVYQEILQGASSARHFVSLQAELDKVPSFAPDDSHETARQAAMLYARCRWAGMTIRSPNDCLIAACAIEADEPLLHADRDFEHIATAAPLLRFVGRS